MKNIIVAIVGMCGSGKSVATEIFKKRGFNNVYFGDVTYNEMKKLNIPVTAESERIMREKIRKDAAGDKGIYAKMLMPKIKEAYLKGNVTLESMYAWSEYKYIKEEFGDCVKILAIIANRKIRYDRLTNRKPRPYTEEEALSRDITQIESIEQGGPIAFADYYIINNGDYESFVKQVEDYINLLEE